MKQKGLKKVFIEPGCITCGTCESVCPSVFRVTDICHVEPQANINEHINEIKEAAEICPVSVIKYDEDEAE